MKFVEIKLDHLQRVVDESGKNAPTLKTLKILFGLMYDYAVMHEIVSQDKRDMVRYVDISKVGIANISSAHRTTSISHTGINMIHTGFPSCLSLDSEKYVIAETRKEPVYDGHRPHDMRHTCVSLLTEKKVDDRVIKKIVGHKGQGVTETVYTHIELPLKLEAII